MPPSMSRVSPTPSSTSVARGRCILVLHHHHPNGTKRQQLAKHRPQSSMPAPKRRHTRKGGNELTLSTDLATECSTARRSIASLYFTLSIRGRKGGRVSVASISTGAALWGCSGLLGQRKISPAMCVFLHGRLFSFRPSKLCGYRTGSPSTSPRRGRYRCIPILPGDVNAKLF